jgi:2'-5' RNA ligase
LRCIETGRVRVEVSALIVPVPEADPVVGQFRAALDSGAALGVPAHITILYPFMPASALDPSVVAQLRGLFDSIDAFEISLNSTAWFDDAVVYVRPEPDAALRKMTSLVAERWPQWPPYEGAHPDPTPHLTLADNGDLSAMRQAAQAVRRSLQLHVEVSEVQLYAGTAKPDTWHHRLTFPLRGRSG